jgi:hypothetical protein
VNPLSSRHALRPFLAGLCLCCASIAIAAEDGWSQSQVALRRLTEAQYRQTIADLFGADLQIPGRFEHDIRTEGLLAVGAARETYSPGGLEQYDLNARSIAGQITDAAHRKVLVSCGPARANQFDEKCAARFLGRVGEGLFRRPLSANELKDAVRVATAAFKAQADFYLGLQYALVVFLESPNFLFRVETAHVTESGNYELDAVSKAGRLSFFLWNAPPDDELLKAALSRSLNTRGGLSRQVERLMASPRLEQGVRAFFSDMLGYESFERLNLDPAIYPRFNNAVASDAREESLRLIVDQLITEKADYRDLFTTRKTFLTRRLGSIYRVPVANATGWSEYEFSPDAGRAGLLTRAAFLETTSNPGTTSPTLRGKAIRELFLCQHVPPPPGNVDFSIVQDTKNSILTTSRLRFQAHTREPMCAGCHKIMDPLGLAFEHFDGTGQARLTENGTPIDASGRLDNKPFNDASEFNAVLHNDPALASCLVSRALAYGIGRAPGEREQDALTVLKKEFTADGYRYIDLLRQMTSSDYFYKLDVPKNDEQKHAGSRVSAEKQTKG